MCLLLLDNCYGLGDCSLGWGSLAAAVCEGQALEAPVLGLLLGNQLLQPTRLLGQQQVASLTVVVSACLHEGWVRHKGDKLTCLSADQALTSQRSQRFCSSMTSWEASLPSSCR